MIVVRYYSNYTSDVFTYFARTKRDFPKLVETIATAHKVSVREAAYGIEFFDSDSVEEDIREISFWPAEVTCATLTASICRPIIEVVNGEVILLD
jgi:hypothetical protein